MPAVAIFVFPRMTVKKAREERVGVGLRLTDRAVLKGQRTLNFRLIYCSTLTTWQTCTNAGAYYWRLVIYVYAPNTDPVEK